MSRADTSGHARAQRSVSRAARAAMLAAVCIGDVGELQGQTVHQLRATPATVVWGYYDSSAGPVLKVASGDVVEIETVLAAAELLRRFGVDEKWITPDMREMDQVKERGAGTHLLVGPIHIEGAEPGDVLEVRIQQIRVRDAWGLNIFRPNGGTIPELFPYAGTRVIPIDLAANVARFAPGIDIPLRPFFGSIGVAPPPMTGRIPSGPPGVHTGNLDNKELVAGTVLYIPVHVRGALLFVGDGHAAQGDGEVDGTALETALAGTLQLIVRKDLKLRWARAETPTHYITMGLNQDLDEAARMATREMVEFLQERYGLGATDAYMLASMAVDLRVTQLVDGVKGIHAMFPKNLVRQSR